MTPLIERDASDTTQAVYTKNPLSIGGIGGLISSYDDTKIHKEKEKKKKKQKYHHYYHDSNLGNVNQITNQSGQVIQTYDYDSFGNIVNQTGSLTTKYAYKTKEYSPETGLIFFGARYYNPLIGRFITKDPLGMVDGPNVYIYCWNDPINKIDPWGLLCGGDDRIKKAIDKLKDTAWGKTEEGKKVIGALEERYKEGKIKVGDLPSDTRAQYDPSTGIITINSNVNYEEYPGRLAHEGTHVVQFKGNKPYNRSSERGAFNNGYAVDTELGIPGAYNPSDEEIRRAYPSLK